MRFVRYRHALLYGSPAACLLHRQLNISRLNPTHMWNEFRQHALRTVRCDKAQLQQLLGFQGPTAGEMQQKSLQLNYKLHHSYSGKLSTTEPQQAPQCPTPDAVSNSSQPKTCNGSLPLLACWPPAGLLAALVPVEKDLEHEDQVQHQTCDETTRTSLSHFRVSRES